MYTRFCIDGLLVPHIDAYGGGSDAIQYIVYYKQICLSKSIGNKGFYIDENLRCHLSPFGDAVYAPIDLVLAKIFEKISELLRNSFERTAYSNTELGDKEMKARLFGQEKASYVFHDADIGKVLGNRPNF